MHVTDRVGTLSSRQPVLANPEDTLRAVAHKLWLEDIGLVVVGDASHPRGVISERDILAALARGADPDGTTAEAVMTNYVISARREDPLFDAAIQMLDSVIRHLPVLDEHGAVSGMVSVRDLLRPLIIDALTSAERGRDPELPDVDRPGTDTER